MKHLVLFLACLWLVGCDGCGGAYVPPGDQKLGSYPLLGHGTVKNCTIPDIPADIEIDAILSRASDGGQIFFTTSNVSYDAGFDGQFFTSAPRAAGSYSWDGGSCNACEKLVTIENFNFALLSPSQSLALGGICPENPLDGGVPGEDPDAGISLPVLSDAGLDAVLACGELKINITGSGFACDPACISCQLTYYLAGKRQ